MINKSIANRAREVFLHGHWVAQTNYQEQTNSVTWQQATVKIQELNSMAQLVFHVNYYVSGVTQVLQGGPLEIRDKFSFDLPPIESQKDWQLLVDQLLTNAELFAQAIEALPSEKLKEPFVDQRYGSYLRNIEGIIEHSYYHLGQLVLIKKLSTNQK